MATFGETGVGGSTAASSDTIMGGHYHPSDGDGLGDFIAAYLNGTGKLKCALCTYIGAGDAGSPITNGKTNEITMTSGAKWHQLPFTVSPSIIDLTEYFILFWVDAATTFYYTSGGAAGINLYKGVTYNGWPDPLSGESASTAIRSVYCSYTPSALDLSQSDEIILC